MPFKLAWPSGGALQLHRLSLGLSALAGLFLLPQPASAQAGDGGKYLDAKFCGDYLNLNPGSEYEGGACQLWKFVPTGDGWARLQLKHNGRFLDADHCTDNLNMNPGSNWDGGSCQLWKFLPEGDEWGRLQLKNNGKFLDASFCSDEVKLSGEFDLRWRRLPVVAAHSSGGWLVPAANQICRRGGSDAGGR